MLWCNCQQFFSFFVDIDESKSTNIRCPIWQTKRAFCLIICSASVLCLKEEIFPTFVQVGQLIYLTYCQSRNKFSPFAFSCIGTTHINKCAARSRQNLPFASNYHCFSSPQSDWLAIWSEIGISGCLTFMIYVSFIFIVSNFPLWRIPNTPKVPPIKPGN